MRTYSDDNMEDFIEISDIGEDGPTFRTYTRGTSEPMYVGDDAEAARESLEYSPDEFNDLLSGDPIDPDYE